MSDTPQTDEAQFGTDRVSVDFASRLERELIFVTEQRDRLAEALRHLMTHGGHHQPVLRDTVANIAKAALAAVKGGSDNLKTKSIRLERWPHDPDPFNSPDHDNGQKNYT
jgi:hypothetical protein